MKLITVKHKSKSVIHRQCPVHHKKGISQKEKCGKISIWHLTRCQAELLSAVDYSYNRLALSLLSCIVYVKCSESILPLTDKKKALYSMSGLKDNLSAHGNMFSFFTLQK